MILLIGFILISCSEKNKNGWTAKQESEFKGACFNSKKGSPDKAWCDCAFDEISTQYSYYEYNSTEYVELSDKEIDMHNKINKEIREKCNLEKTN